MSVDLIEGDCREAVRELADNSIDSCVTDPPYALVSVRKRFGSPTAAPAQFGTDGAFSRASRGFMGKTWDTGDVAHDPAFWAEVLRVLKPGAHLLAFGGTRTYHRLACAIEDAGFEIRDTVFWVYGSGMPMSHDQGEGRGTRLKPAVEPITMARKPFPGSLGPNLAQWSVGALYIESCRVPSGGDKGRWPANLIHDGGDEVLAAFPKGAARYFYCAKASRADRDDGLDGFEKKPLLWSAGTQNPGSFQSAGTDKSARNPHPTVKPTELMRYLCRLVTPPGGTVLDPFMGSGSTGRGAVLEGFSFIGVEMDASYFDIADARIAAAERRAAPRQAAE